MDPPAEPHIFATPRKQEGIGGFLKRLNVEYDLKLPWNAHESPSRRPQTLEQDVVGKVQFLYYQDRPRLDKGVDEFRHYLPQLSAKQTRLSCLFEILSVAQTNSLKARKSQSVQASPRGRRSPAGNDLPEPASPTLGIKHAPPSSAEMPGDNARRSPVRTARKQSLKRPASTSSFHERLMSAYPGNPGGPASRFSNHEDHSNGIMPPPAPVDSSTRNRGIASNNTSFNSNGLTSANTSFWSDAQHGTQEEPQTPATSVDHSFHTPDGKMDSTLSLDGTDNQLNHSSADLLNHNSALGLDGANDNEDYGSSPRFDDGFGPTQLEQACSPSKYMPRESDYSEFDGSIATQDAYNVFANLDPFVPRRPPVLSPPKTDPRPNIIHEFTGLDRILQISRDGLSGVEMPISFLQLRFDLRWEAIRALRCGGLTSEEFEMEWTEPRTMQSLHQLSQRKGIKYEYGFETTFADHSIVARLRLTGAKRGRVFDLEPLPPRKDDSNALERKFGRGNFMIVDLEQLDRPPEGMGLDEYRWRIPIEVTEMLKRPQYFAGRVWQAFLVQPKKRRRSKTDSVKATLQVHFYAIESEAPAADPCEPRSICAVLDWAVQFDQNAGSAQAKMYSRLDLSASRTTPTVVFSRNQIVLCADKRPTDDSDDTSFHDNTIPFDPTKKADDVMDDGCCKISTGAMKEIQRIMGLESTPSVVQGRIFGAKGVWFRDDADADEPIIKIWISESQIKVKQKSSMDRDLDKLTFNVVQTSGQVHSSFLYADFLPILVDRKVPWAAIEGIVEVNARAIGEEFLTSLSDRMALAEWITRYRRIRDTRLKRGAIYTIGGFPVAPEEQILRLLAAGFEPTSCSQVMERAKTVFDQYVKEVKQKFKMPLPNSTFLMGIADPKDVLQPGEIHVGFSKPFQDATQARSNLWGLEALVSRLPSLGAPDIQRVKCVFKPELGHLTDVVVFPTKGPRSLASKLQGGDYDGDQFVIIWERSLVKHFRNAPVPDNEQSPEDFGIQVDRRKLGSMVQEPIPNKFEERQVLDWVHHNIAKRLQYDRLGQITLLYEKIVYHKNGLTSAEARQTLRLHDLMIDAAKQGYTLPIPAMENFKKKHRLRDLEGKVDPAHRTFSKGLSTNPKQKAFDIAKKRNNISDRVFFEILEPSLQKASEEVERVVKDAKKYRDDEELGRVYVDTLAAMKGSPAHTELRELASTLREFRDRWNATMEEWNERMESKEQKARQQDVSWAVLVQAARQEFETIMPQNSSDVLINGWTTKIGADPSLWDKLKASCLLRVKATPRCMFSAAGYELCHLKAFAGHLAVSMRPDVYLNSSVRRPKRKAARDEEDDDGIGKGRQSPEDG